MFKHYEAWNNIKNDNKFYVRTGQVFIQSGDEPFAGDPKVNQTTIEKLTIKYDSTCRKVDRLEVFYLFELDIDTFEVVPDIEVKG